MTDRLIQLLEKYDVPGPRYTSYPTVPAWTEAVTAKDYRDNLERVTPSSERLSLYFHIPFCETLCHYCGCMTVITKDHERSGPYSGLLQSELEAVGGLLSQGGLEVSQLHLGGGTPNFLKPQELSELMAEVRRFFKILPDAEVAIEMHPRTTTIPFLEALSEEGFNRISIGVQDFDPKVQKLIHRDQTYEMTEGVIKLLRGLGFKSFNFDLVYGLPGQSYEGWARSLDLVAALRPNRLAVYSYAHVPWVKSTQRSFKDSDLPTPQMKIRLFEQAYRRLTREGYRLIGMDHFALEGDELYEGLVNGTIHRNFMGYSTRKDAHQLGFGVSAISYVNGNYFQNHKDLKVYEKAISHGDLATFRGFLTSEDDRLRRDLIQEILCRGRIECAAFESRWNISFAEYFREALPALEDLARDGLLERGDHEIRATAAGRLFLRNIAMAFDPYLSKVHEKASNPVFSRTV